MRGLAVACLAAVIGAGCAVQQTGSTDRIRATYACADGRMIEAVYAPPDRAQLLLNERTLDMTITRSASGARYVGSGLVWWTKGSGEGSIGTLFSYAADLEQTGERITICEQQASDSA